MPAVVRGGRRQGAIPTSKRGPGRKGAAARHASPLPGKMAAIGRVDLSPRATAMVLAAGVMALGVVLGTGARAERIGRSISSGMNGAAANLGLVVEHIRIVGASVEAEPAIRRALGVGVGQPIAGLDLDAVRQRVQTVGWVEEARVVRLLPHTLIVEVKEHDRLAVWQVDGRIQVIDPQGRVIDGADARRYPELPLVVGRGADAAAAAVLPLLTQRPRLMGRIDALVRVDERRWDLRLKDGGIIQLPATKQEAALIILDALDQRERLLDLGFARLDLRTPGEVAIRSGDGA